MLGRRTIFDAETRARQVRERAERRWGQLYAASQKARGRSKAGPQLPEVTAEDGPTLADMGVTRRQPVEWQRLAEGADGAECSR